MADSLRFIQVNCGKSYVEMTVLGGRMSESNASVALVQEPSVLYGEVRGLPSGYRCFTSKVISDGIGVSAIVVGDCGLDVLVIDKCTNEYGVCALIEGAIGRIYVASMYCRFGADLEPYLRYMDDLLETSGNVPLILGMDANAVSPLWFSKGLDRSRGHTNEVNGRLLEEWVLEKNMNVLNEPSEWYTFSGPNGSSDIDVTLTNEAGLRFDYEWSVCPDYSVSDHNHICVKVSLSGLAAGPGLPPPARWVTKDTDWDEYMNDMRLRANECGLANYGAASVDTKVSLLTEWIHGTNDCNMRRAPVTRVYANKWWSDVLECKKMALRQLRRAYQRGRRMAVESLEALRSCFRTCDSEYKKMISKAKLDHWREYVREEGNENPWGRVYKLCRGKRKAAEICSVKVNGVYTDTWTSSVNALMNSFFPDSIDDMNEVERLKAIARPPPPALEEDEVRNSIWRCKRNKSPGPDGMDAGMIRAVWGAIPEYMSCLYEQCLMESYFPRAWKVASLVILLKSADRVKSDPGSYRPICLLDTLGKVLEGIMVKRLERKLENVNTSSFQFGFTHGKSTEDAWRCVQEKVNASEKKYVLGIDIDFKGAFDNLSWLAMLGELDATECDEFNLWVSYFEGREVRLRGQNEIVCKDVFRGCPQGSKSGPAMWNLVMDNLLKAIVARGFFIAAFADDGKILIESDSRAELERMGNECMQICGEWGEKVCVPVSIDKTMCILMKGRLSINRPPTIQLNGTTVKYVMSAVYLGIRYAERMKFKPHLEYVRKKMLSLVGGLRRVLRKDWGLGRKATCIIYKGLFVACMSYGASVWFRTLRYAYARDLLNRCQRHVLYACLNVCRTVSTDAMQVLHGELPWDLEATRRGLLSEFRRGIAPVDGDPITYDEVRDLNKPQCKNFLAERMMNIWQNRWDQSPKGRITYEFIPNVRFASEHERFAPGLCLGYLLTGHGSMNEYLHKRGLCDSPVCLCGAPLESVKHLLSECQIYEDLRDLSRSGLRIEGGTLNVSGALATSETYESLNEFAVALFARRKRRMNVE